MSVAFFTKIRPFLAPLGVGTVTAGLVLARLQSFSRKVNAALAALDECKKAALNSVHLCGRGKKDKPAVAQTYVTLSTLEDKLHAAFGSQNVYPALQAELYCFTAAIRPADAFGERAVTAKTLGQCVSDIEARRNSLKLKIVSYASRNWFYKTFGAHMKES